MHFSARVNVYTCIDAFRLVPFPQRWTEDEQAQEELPGSWADCAELWGGRPQVRAAPRRLSNMNACAPTAGFSVCGHPTLLAGTVSKETNLPSHSLIVRAAPH